MTLQETLREMADLLGQQQKQLDAQRKELDEQRELIRQLQGAQETVKKEPTPSPVEKPPADTTETVIAQQPDTTTATETRSECAGTSQRSVSKTASRPENTSAAGC